jgi:predicted RND superfamily exporter protein
MCATGLSLFLLVVIGPITSLGLMSLIGIRLNMAVVGAFPVLIGLGIDYAIQFHARFDEEARKGSLEDAVFMTVTRTGPAVMYAMLPTTMDFVAMYVSTVPMIRSFGIVSIIGINTCFWVSCLGMPTITLLVNYKPKQQLLFLPHSPPNVGVVTLRTNTQPHEIRNRSLAIKGHRHGGLPSSHTHRLKRWCSCFSDFTCFTIQFL